jgi:hypothetical protein
LTLRITRKQLRIEQQIKIVVTLAFPLLDDGLIQLSGLVDEYF